ncbi:MAG: pyrroline-5-carboxylate reductase [Spirochaetaceae bacterium]|jgi:pyrroline-5-carboxylate reductase|nr:pyrroline-5-carboxylate reductase [Spirochaetaceae bacterium]
MKTLSEIKVGFIGSGAMGSALARAAARALDGTRVFVTCRTASRRDSVAEELGVRTALDNPSLVTLCDVVFIAVKPAQLPAVLNEISPRCAGKVLVSAAAGVPLASIRAALSGASPAALFRVMPNIAASIGESMTALAPEQPAPATVEAAAALVAELLSPGGPVEQVDEGLMDCVTAISGSGPAYGFIFIEALADAAVGMGMPRQKAYRFAAQTLKGAAALVLETGCHPAVLKDSVCSPAGTTIEAVRALESGAFRSTIIEAARRAAGRSRSISSQQTGGQ